MSPKEPKDLRIRPKRQRLCSREEFSCPTCGLSLRQGEIQSHLQQEIDKICSIAQSRPVSQRPDPNRVYTYNLDAVSKPYSYKLRRSKSSTSDVEMSPVEDMSDTNATQSTEPTTEVHSCSSTFSNGSTGENETTSSGMSSNGSSTENYVTENIIQSPVLTSLNSGTSSNIPSQIVSTYILKKMTADQIKRAKVVRQIRCQRVYRRHQFRERLALEDERTCPQCDRLVHPLQFRAHLDACIEEDDAEASGESDTERDEGSLPQYEWCGLTRVRATDVLRSQGLLHALGTVVQRGPEDAEVDVCDDDDFGPQQFFEGGVHNAETSGEPESCTSGSSVNGGIPEEIPTTSHNCYGENSGSSNASCAEQPLPWCSVKDSQLDSYQSTESLSNSANAMVTNTLQHRDCPNSSPQHNSNLVDESCSNSSLTGEVEGLRREVQQLRNEATTTRAERLKCSVCRDDYQDALVSTVCWHVHCSQCWMRTVAARRQCPQCKAIFSLSNLRRVYL